MKAVRENSVVIKQIKEDKSNDMGIIVTGFDGFNEGKVISSAHASISEGDIVIYDDALTVGEYKVVFEGNIIAIK